MKLRPVHLLFSFVLLAGCNSISILDSTGATNYYDGAFEFATQSGFINTAVVGSPFGKNPSSDFAQKVAGYMRGMTPGREVVFTPSKGNTNKDAFHVVVVFNGVQPLSDRQVCRANSRTPTQGRAATTHMLAIFCQGAHPLSSASGYVKNLNGEKDLQFESLVRQVAQVMIPRFDENETSNDVPLIR